MAYPFGDSDVAGDRLGRVPAARLDALDRALCEATDASTITWGLRQVAFACA
jgi:hypothetical protein